MLAIKYYTCSLCLHIGPLLKISHSGCVCSFLTNITFVVLLFFPYKHHFCCLAVLSLQTSLLLSCCPFLTNITFVVLLFFPYKHHFCCLAVLSLQTSLLLSCCSFLTNITFVVLLSFSYKHHLCCTLLLYCCSFLTNITYVVHLCCLAVLFLQTSLMLYTFFVLLFFPYKHHFCCLAVLSLQIPLLLSCCLISVPFSCSLLICFNNPCRSCPLLLSTRHDLHTLACLFLILFLYLGAHLVLPQRYPGLFSINYTHFFLQNLAKYRFFFLSAERISLQFLNSYLF